MITKIINQFTVQIKKVFIGSMLVLTALLISACADDSNSDNEVAITVTVGSSS